MPHVGLVLNNITPTPLVEKLSVNKTEERDERQDKEFLFSELAPRYQRGPICFDCNYFSSLSECSAVQLCEEGDVCNPFSM